jgi:molybdopterin converting factor small subunit
VELELPEGSTVGDLVAHIVGRFPDISSRPDTLVVAVNQEYQDHAFRLGDGDEVALIPPVSGGRHD